MAHQRGLVSIARSLERVLIIPYLSRPARPLPRPSRRHLSATPQARKTYSRPPRPPAFGNDPDRGGQGPDEASLPRDELIRSWTVQLVGAEGKLQRPVQKADVLSGLDRKTHYLQQVSPVDAAAHQFPICKVVERAAEREREKLRRRREVKLRATSRVKQVELTWITAEHDLEIKMRRVAEFLAEGRRVEVLIQNKKRTRFPGEEESRRVLAAVRRTVEETDGAREVKADGVVGKRMMLSAEGKRAGDVEDEDEDEDEAGSVFRGG